jgi:hypothetical protein
MTAHPARPDVQVAPRAQHSSHIAPFLTIFLPFCLQISTIFTIFFTII